MQEWAGGFWRWPRHYPDAVRNAAAPPKRPGKPEAFMRRESLALTEQIGALAANGEYVKLMTVSGELLKGDGGGGRSGFHAAHSGLPGLRSRTIC